MSHRSDNPACAFARPARGRLGAAATGIEEFHATIARWVMARAMDRAGRGDE